MDKVGCMFCFVFFNDVGGFCGQMTAEFQLASPLVETRESYFGRFCKQLAPYTWGVVDISLEDLFPYPSIGFCRKPSGCLIQACPDGISKVLCIFFLDLRVS